MSNITIQGKKSSDRTKVEEIYSTSNDLHVRTVATDITPASRDIFLDYFFGTDAALSSALTAGSENIGVVLEMRELNPHCRTIVIVAGATGDFDYDVYFSRSGIDADKYATTLTADTIAAGFVVVNIPATEGYDQYVHLGIRPETGEAGAQLTFRAYLSGRGG